MKQKKYNTSAKYVCINTDAHSQLLAHSLESGIRIGHFVSKAILEKLAREKKTEKVMHGFPGECGGFQVSNQEIKEAS